MKMYKDYGLYLGNKWEKGEDGTFEVINPCDESVIGLAPNASKAQITKAIDLAQDCAKTWGALDAWQRCEKLQNVATNMKNSLEDIAQAISLESGKPLAQAKREVQLSLEQFTWFGEQTKRIKGQILESRIKNTKVYVEYEPIGTVGAFSSWNFPVLLLARKIAPALAAKCPIIIRSSKECVLSAMKLIQACHDAGLPKGLVSLLCGDANTISTIIADDERVKKLSLTGSSFVGSELIKQSAKTFKKVTMELGGHAPVLIFPDVKNLQELAKTCCSVKFANSGQVCVSPTRFYVHKDIIDEFCKYFIEEAKKIKIGSGLDESTTMGPLINKKRLVAIKEFITEVKNTKGDILLGGKEAAGFSKGYYFEPTIIRDLEDCSKLLCDEIFGPIALIQTFSTFDEVIKKANSTAYGLASYAFTSSLELANKCQSEISSGMVGINSFALAAAEIPFGGIKASGFGRESGELGMTEYLNTKIITMQTS